MKITDQEILEQNAMIFDSILTIIEDNKTPEERAKAIIEFLDSIGYCTCEDSDG